MNTKVQANIAELKRILCCSSLLKHKIKKKIVRKLPLRLLYRLGILFMPYEAEMCLTSRCNLKCKMCGFRKSDRLFKMKDMDLEENKEVIKKISKFNPSVRLIGAGEPLLYKDIIPVLECLKDNGLVVTLVTNGTSLEGFAENIFNLKIYSVNISLDGTEEVHDSIRGVRGSYSQAINGLRKISELKREKGSVFPELRVNCTISNLNFECIDKFTDEIVKEDIDRLNFFHIFFTTKSAANAHNTRMNRDLKALATDDASNYKIDIATLQSNIDYIKTKYKHMNIIFQPDINGESLTRYYRNPDEDIINRERCIIPWTKMYILPDASVIPMYMCVDCALGNIKNNDATGVWDGKRFNQFRKELINRRGFSICSRCCGLFAK